MRGFKVQKDRGKILMAEFIPETNYPSRRIIRLFFDKVSLGEGLVSIFSQCFLGTLFQDGVPSGICFLESNRKKERENKQEVDLDRSSLSYLLCQACA